MTGLLVYIVSVVLVAVGVLGLVWLAVEFRDERRPRS